MRTADRNYFTVLYARLEKRRQHIIKFAFNRSNFMFSRF
jgi:hypothetical protein